MMHAGFIIGVLRESEDGGTVTSWEKSVGFLIDCSAIYPADRTFHERRLDNLKSNNINLILLL
jgi:hypothetical protein